MFFDDTKDLDIPMEERIFIQPKARQQLFINLVENYKLFCPTINMIYAALNYNSELKIDYLVVFETITEGKQIILWDAPYIYTSRCIPAYRYVVQNNLHKEFFNSCAMHFSQIDIVKFIEFLNSDLCGNLSIDTKDPTYWKNPENANVLMKGMSELSLLYKPQGFRAKRPNLN